MAEPTQGAEHTLKLQKNSCGVQNSPDTEQSTGTKRTRGTGQNNPTAQSQAGVQNKKSRVQQIDLVVHNKFGLQNTPLVQNNNQGMQSKPGVQNKIGLSITNSGALNTTTPGCQNSPGSQNNPLGLPNNDPEALRPRGPQRAPGAERALGSAAPPSVA